MTWTLTDHILTHVTLTDRVTKAVTQHWTLNLTLTAPGITPEAKADDIATQIKREWDRLGETDAGKALAEARACSRSNYVRQADITAKLKALDAEVATPTTSSARCAAIARDRNEAGLAKRELENASSGLTGAVRRALESRRAELMGVKQRVCAAVKAEAESLRTKSLAEMPTSAAADVLVDCEAVMLAFRSGAVDDLVRQHLATMLPPV